MLIKTSVAEQMPAASVAVIERLTFGVTMSQQETVAAELKAASASLILAMAAVENGDWAAAEQGVIDAQQHSDVAMGEIRSKLCEPPTPVEELDDDRENGAHRR